MSGGSYTLAGPARPGTSLAYHILERQRAIPGASGDFTELFQQITLATKTIHSLVRRAGLVNVIGSTGLTNVQGEIVQKLDEFANQTIIKSVEAGGHVCVMASEENDELIPVPPESHGGKYVLLFDPLDGSGNIDVNASIGTIFAIYRRRSPVGGPGTLDDVLQPGRDMVAAGYVVYGSSMMLVYTAGRGVHGFTYDPTVGEYFLSHENIRIPDRGDTYSINEGNYHRWPEGLRRWVDWIKTPEAGSGRPYSARYIGAMVADLHRTLLRGGIFVYPGDVKRPEGKLRLLYEANPLAFIVEAAGGAASDGRGAVLDVVPTSLHQRTPLFVGSRLDVADCVAFLRGER
ncbi:MAG: class 1 fructose-bisphosphatase [Myxococcota bacterium]|nr:class 1 fructose-bisphosphatase [Myxococcota bacterium]MDW8361586.1 class 1 fructose-bisphosphatase [Myxococcales bacterium]